MYSLAQLKPGLVIQLDGRPYLITASTFSKPARGGGVAKTTLKSLLTGASLHKTFQGQERIEPAQITYSKAQYLYHDGEDYYFMDSSSFEQFGFKKADLDYRTNYLIEGMEVDIQNLEGKPINVQLPPKINLKVVKTEPGVRGNTAQGGSKPATLETSLVVQVPLFVTEGDVVRINTETGEYVERV